MTIADKIAQLKETNENEHTRPLRLYILTAGGKEFRVEVARCDETAVYSTDGKIFAISQIAILEDKSHEAMR